MTLLLLIMVCGFGCSDDSTSPQEKSDDPLNQIVAWGDNDYGQSDVPSPNSDFVAIACGNLHNLGLKSDGTIVAWGFNNEGQCEVPTPNSDFLAVAGGSNNSIAIRK